MEVMDCGLAAIPTRTLDIVDACGRGSNCQRAGNKLELVTLGRCRDGNRILANGGVGRSLATEDGFNGPYGLGLVVDESVEDQRKVGIGLPFLTGGILDGSGGVNLLDDEIKAAREARKLEAILKYTRYTLMPHGFTDEELYQIEEAVKLLLELNGVTRMEVLSIGKKKGLKQADLKNFCWNIANQYGIDPKTTALFALNLFYA